MEGNNFYSKIFFAIIAVSLVLSLWGIASDLACSRVPTEIEQVRFAVKYGSGDFNPRIFYHPPVFSYLLFFLYVGIFVAGRIFSVFASVSGYEIFYFTRTWFFYLLARFAVLSLSALTLCVFYKTASDIYGRRKALLSVLFLGLVPVFIKWSHYASTDIPAMFLSVAAFYFIFNVYRRGAWADYILSGALIGLAIAAKYHAALLVLPFLAACFFRRSGFVRMASGLACVFAGFFAGCPYAFLDHKAFLGGIFELSRRLSAKYYQFASWKIDKPGFIYVFTDTLPFAVGVPLSVLMMAGIVYAFFRRRKEDILQVIFIMALFFIVARGSVIKPRYFLPALPFMMLLAAGFLDDFIEKLSFVKRKGLILFLLAVLFVAPSAYASIRFDALLNKKPISIQCKEWVEANIASGSATAMQAGVPLNPDGVSMQRKLAEIQKKNIGPGAELKKLIEHAKVFKKAYDIYELPFPWREDFDESDFDFPAHVKSGVRYFIFTDEMDEYTAAPQKYPVQAKYYNLVAANSDLIREFSEEVPPIEPGCHKKGYIKIYRLKKEYRVR